MADERDLRIGPMSELSDYKVAGDDPDPRGWDVIAADGRRIGEVEDLIVDAGAGKVRYLDVEVDDDLRVDRDHRILIPIGQAHLDPDDDNVRVNTLSAADVRTMPRYSGTWSRTEEERVRQHFGTDTAGTPGASAPGRTGGIDYGHEHYSEDRFFGARRSTRTDPVGDDEYTRRNRG